MIRRSALTALVAALSIAFGAGSAHAADVKVVAPNGSPKNVSIDDVSPDVEDTGYAVRSGSGTRTETVTGVSLNKIIGAAGIDTFNGFKTAEISRPGGGAVTLSAEQVRNSGNRIYPDGPPVVYVKQGNPAFLRPSTGGGDTNAGDTFEVTSGPLVVTLTDTSRISIEAAASKRAVKAGETVRFSASVSAPGGEDVRVKWTIVGESGRGSGTTFSHRFTRRGSYDVVAGATSAGDPTGTSDVITIKVGKPKTGGPDRKGGGKSDDGSDSGAYNGNGPGTGTGPGVGLDAGAGSGDPESDQQAPERRPGDRRVTGELLADVAPAEPESSPDSPELRSGTEEPEDGSGVPGAVLAGATVLGLLGAGAFKEVRP